MRHLHLLLLVLLLGCVPGRPSPADTAAQYFAAWEQGRYQDMYALLSQQARANVSEERFVTRYKTIYEGLSVTSVRVQGGEARRAQDDGSVEVPYQVTFESSRLGQFGEENSLPLVFVNDTWRVQWSPSLIFRGLEGENVVRLVPDDPPRGRIVDREGRALATQGDILTVGIVPGRIQNEDALLDSLARYLQLDREAIRGLYARANPDWFVPVRDLPADTPLQAPLSQIPGVAFRHKSGRVYPGGSLAAHTVGFVGEATAEELQKLRSRGYEEGDVVGRSGIEEWAEEVLAGQKGGRAVVVDSQGTAIRTIAERSAVAGGTVQLSLDSGLQRKAEEVLSGRPGSVVALDPRDGSVLALASSPGFDPNAFALGITARQWQQWAQDPRHPFQHRPVASSYPTGSLFKVVTMAAALERGGFSPDSTFVSTGEWRGPGGLTLRDWKAGGHGVLDLRAALAESCNSCFAEVARALDAMDSGLLPEFARAFGFGSKTGLIGLPEEAGQVPDPVWKRESLSQDWFLGDSVNLALGQGYLLATPLQVARAYAAIAADGVLRTPVLVQRMVGTDGAAKTFSSAESGRLPVSPASLRAIREAMKATTLATTGTAYAAFRGAPVTVAAKTGSAENPDGEPHAWFAGFAPADAPELVVVVMIENAGLSSETAAPAARQLIDYYFGRRSPQAEAR